MLEVKELSNGETYHMMPLITKHNFSFDCDVTNFWQRDRDLCKSEMYYRSIYTMYCTMTYLLLYFNTLVGYEQARGHNQLSFGRVRISPKKQEISPENSLALGHIIANNALLYIINFPNHDYLGE